MGQDKNLIWEKRIASFLLGVVLLAVPFLLGRYLVFVLSVICVYTIVALGMNILCGYTGMLSLGHQAFFGIGAYCAAVLPSQLSWFPFPVALMVGGALSGIVGYLLGFSALRTSGVYLAIATIAFGMIMEEIFSEWSAVTGGQSGMAVLSPALGSVRLESSTELFYLILGITVIMFILAMNLISSNVGRAFVAIRESEISAQSYGISLVKHKTLAFAISAFYVGVAGGLYAYLVKFIAPIDFKLLVGIEFVITVVVGGLATIGGSVMGAILLFSLPQLFAGLTDWQEMVTGFILLIVILFLREGMWGGICRLVNRARGLLFRGSKESIVRP